MYVFICLFLSLTSTHVYPMLHSTLLLILIGPSPFLTFPILKPFSPHQKTQQRVTGGAAMQDAASIGKQVQPPESLGTFLDESFAAEK